MNNLLCLFTNAPKKIRKYSKLITLIVVILSTISYTEPARAQAALGRVITLKLNHVTLRSALSQIEDKGQCKLIYDEHILPLSAYISVDIKKQSLHSALILLLKSYPVKIEEADGYVLIKAKKSTSSKPVGTVNGSVVDAATGETLVGVTVSVKGTSTAVSTNAKGEYSINAVNEDAVLVFSYIGYTSKEVIVESQNHIDIKMVPSIASLNQVVVVGYGTQKKIDLTGAVTQIRGDVLDERPSPNIARGLEGVVPNLNIVMTDGKPIRSPVFNIRGTTSIGSGGQALVLIDGVPGDPSLVNPNDIDNISVLKDAASSAIYGARGAYGVVLINTKNPKQGKTQISFSTNYTINQKTVEPSIVSNGYEWAKNFAESYYAWYDYRSQPSTINGVLPYSPSYLDSLKARTTNSSLPQVTVDPTTGRYVYYGNTNWYKQLYRAQMPASEYALNISSSTKNTSFYISGRYYNQKGVYTYNPDDFSRYNLRIKGNINITPWLTLTDNLDFNTYSYFYPLTNGNAPVTRYLDVTAVPMGVMYNPDGTLTPSSYFSVGDLATGNNNSNTTQLYLKNTVSLNADVIKNHLNLKADFSYAYTNYNVLSKFYPVTYSAGPGIYGRSNNNYLNNSTSITKYMTTNIYAEGKKDFGKHSLKLLVGTNIEDNKINTNSYQRDGLIDPALPNFNLLNGTNYSITGGGNE